MCHLLGPHFLIFVLINWITLAGSFESIYFITYNMSLKLFKDKITQINQK